MDFLSIGFLLLIVVVSGGIAYLADNLGRKLGKKRLTIFGLRPRHTAALGVILTGAIVSLLTIVFVGVVSSDVRAWILHGREAIRQLKITDDQLHKLQSEQVGLQAKNTRLGLENAEKARKSAAQDKIIEERRAKIAELTKKVEDGSARIKTLDQKLVSKQRDLDRSKHDLSVAQNLLADIQKKILIAQRTRNEAVRQSNEVKTRNLALETQNADLESRVSSLKSDVTKLTTEMADLTKARTEIGIQLATAQQQLQESQTRLTETEIKLRDTERDLARLSAQYKLDSEFYNAISLTFEKSRVNPLAFRRGEEIVRLALPPALTAVQASRAVDDLLRAARAEATKQGAVASGKFSEADIIDHTDRATNRTITGDEIKAALAKQVGSSDEGLVMIAYSTLNAFAGEPVSLEVTVYPNPLIYKMGQVLAEATIDGKKSAIEIFAQVSEFLGTKVRAKAESDKLLPRIGSAAQFGSIAPSEILELVDRIREFERKVSIRAMASEDTRAADELHLKFGLR